ncbi:Uncharacterised protein [Vibrio cholerae]|nr:Uncharacterised protein [Vibrio cholerae]
MRCRPDSVSVTSTLRLSYLLRFLSTSPLRSSRVKRLVIAPELSNNRTCKSEGFRQ